MVEWAGRMVYWVMKLRVTRKGEGRGEPVYIVCHDLEDELAHLAGTVLFHKSQCVG